MLASLFLLVTNQDSFTTDLDRLAKARDVAGLSAKAPGAWTGRNPFTVIKTNSAYDTGRFGWTAISGEAPWGQKYVVFSTPLTSEDVGERLFESDGSKLTKFIDEREDFGWRIGHQGLIVTFSIPAKKVAITNTFPVHSTGKSANLVFRMGPNYRVKTLKKNLTDPVQWTQLGGVVMVLGAKDGDKLTMNYEAVVDKPGFAGSIRPNEAMLTNDYWYPMIARKPMPFSINIRGPKDWTAITHGEMISTFVEGEYRETLYQMEMPISYWSLNIGPYKTESQKIEDRDYKAWSMVLSEDQMKIQPKFFPLIIKTMEQNFGKYPFSGYGTVVTPTYGGGALEGYSFVTSGYFSGEDSHEIGHTWFGGFVNNTYLKSLWNESFAVWVDGFYFRNALLGSKEERSLAYIQTPGVEDSAYNLAPLSDAPAELGPDATTLGYGKGAFVLQVLEQELGTDLMVKICRDWLAKHDKTVGGEWEDFEKAVEAGAGKSYKWFFDQWVHRPGFAQFTVSDVRYANGAVTGEVKFSGPSYVINSDVLLEVGGKRTFTKVRLAPGQFRIPVAGKPSLVSIDPWRRIVRKIASDEKPLELDSQFRSLRRVDYRPDAGWLRGVSRPGQKPTTKDYNGLLLVGTPQDDAGLRPLYEKVGVSVQGNQLSYKGTTINLEKGGFVALVDLPGGGQCAIGAGKIQYPPRFGRTRMMVFDELGRFVRGVTEPKTKGSLTFRL